MSDDPTVPTRSIKRAAVLVGLGLLVQLATAFHWTPGAFIIASVVGLPLVVVGGLLFLVAIVRMMKSKGAL